MADVEGVIAEAKQEGTMARARCRGTPLFHVQVPVDFAAINCKRLVRFAHAATGLAAGPAAAGARTAGPSSLQMASDGEVRRVGHERSTASSAAIWSFSVCLN
jgi:hypothetical protein